MTSSDRPKRPSARPSARPAGPPAGETREGAAPAEAGGSNAGGRAGQPAAGSRAQARASTAKSNAARVSARRGADAQSPAGVKGRAPDKRADPRRDAPQPGSARVQSPADKPRKAGKRPPAPAAPSPPAPSSAPPVFERAFAPGTGSRAPAPAAPSPPAPSSAPPAFERAFAPGTGSRAPTHASTPATPVSLPTAPAANDDGDDVFSAVDPHAELVAGLSLSAEQVDEPGEGPPGAQPLSRLTRGSGSDRRAQEAALKGAQSLLSSDYYVRQYGAHGMRSLSADVDEYGLDPHVEERARPWLELLCTRYFRLELEGARRIPGEGRALLVANRSGSVPWDGLMLHTALRMQRPELQPVRWLSEDSVIHYPFLGVFMNRLGAVRACPENAERLLSQDRLVAVFPEGAQGSHKLFKDRYRLQRFGRGGYVKLALKLGAPILPTAIIGAEETNPLLARLKLFGRASGDEFLPITPTFPWLGPAGLLPAPVKWRVIVGEPVDLSGYGPDAAEDALVVHRLNEQIRSILQALLDQGTASRRSVLFG
jgi:1-acyl-sn-glycerol-3-phosphate acyltransferase